MIPSTLPLFVRRLPVEWVCLEQNKYWIETDLNDGWWESVTNKLRMLTQAELLARAQTPSTRFVTQPRVGSQTLRLDILVQIMAGAGEESWNDWPNGALKRLSITDTTLYLFICRLVNNFILFSSNMFSLFGIFILQDKPQKLGTFYIFVKIPPRQKPLKWHKQTDILCLNKQ